MNYPSMFIVASTSVGRQKIIDIYINTDLTEIYHINEEWV